MNPEQNPQKDEQVVGATEPPAFEDALVEEVSIDGMCGVY